MKESAFTLKGFINKCKALLPTYFKELKKSVETKEGLKFGKKVLVDFLKEYFKQNNNKFGRTKFNVNFLNTYLSETLIKNYSGFQPLTILQIQRIIRNFISFLTLNNVLHEVIEQEVVIMSELAEPAEKGRYPVQDEAVEEDSYEHFEDNIFERAEKLVNLFYESTYFKNLSDDQKNSTYKVVIAFTGYMYRYCYQRPEEWDKSAIKEVCLNHLPERAAAGRDFFTALSPVLMAFFQFLSDRGVITDTQANDLKMVLYSIDDVIVEYAMNSENWSISKATLMEARERGVDIENREERDFYLISKMLEHNSGVSSPSFLSEEEVDALSTEEIIKRLRRFGVRFQKTQFLKDVNRFYSASKLADNWKKKYTLTAEGRDLDFISLSAVILWDRLAPDIPNLEKIEEMVQKGYDLLDEIKPKAACDRWLKAWDYLKELLPAEIKNINNVNEVIGGIDYVYKWTLDLACYLNNAGLKHEKYHKKRIDYILDVLNRFPNSEDDYTSTMRNDLAETYFLIGEEEKGEKLFKNIIERYPEFLWGYLSWGDQYADVDREVFNYKKAKSIYEMALKQIDFHRDDIKSRIKALERKREGLKTKQKIISWYRSSLSEDGLSEKTVQTRINHIDPFLKYIIFYLRNIYFELIIDNLKSDDILDFLGTWIIQQELATSDSEINEFCQHLKSFITFVFSDNIIPRELLTEFRQICDSEGYFIMLLRKYQDIYKSSPNLKKLFPKLQEWEEYNCYSKWYGWYKLNQGEEEEEPEKVRLSDEKRKFFGDMKDFL